MKTKQIMKNRKEKQNLNNINKEIKNQKINLWLKYNKGKIIKFQIILSLLINIVYNLIIIKSKYLFEIIYNLQYKINIISTTTTTT